MTISKLKKMKKDELIAEVQKLQKGERQYVASIADLNRQLTGVTKANDSRLKKMSKLESDVSIKDGKIAMLTAEVAKLEEIAYKEEPKGFWAKLFS